MYMHLSPIQLIKASVVTRVLQYTDIKVQGVCVCVIQDIDEY